MQLSLEESIVNKSLEDLGIDSATSPEDPIEAEAAAHDHEAPLYDHKAIGVITNKILAFIKDGLSKLNNE